MEDIQAKQSKPNCTECHGCRVQIQPLKAVTAFGQDFRVEVGASPEWIFTAGDNMHRPEHSYLCKLQLLSSHLTSTLI
jgi:hypothetical protein